MNIIEIAITKWQQLQCFDEGTVCRSISLEMLQRFSRCKKTCWFDVELRISNIAIISTYCLSGNDHDSLRL